MNPTEHYSFSMLAPTRNYLPIPLLLRNSNWAGAHIHQLSNYIIYTIYNSLYVEIGYIIKKIKKPLKWLKFPCVPHMINHHPLKLVYLMGLNLTNSTVIYLPHSKSVNLQHNNKIVKNTSRMQLDYFV